jgi:MFS family permease
MNPTNITLAPATAVAPSLAPTSVRYQVLGWLCSLSMITYIDRVCIMQVQGDMQRDLGLTTQQFAWAFSFFALAYAAFEVPTGWLGDRIGPRKVLTRIVLCWLLFTALTGCVPRWDAGLYVPVMGFVTCCWSFASSSAPARPAPTPTSPGRRATGSRSRSAAGLRGWCGRSAAGEGRWRPC